MNTTSVSAIRAAKAAPYRGFRFVYRSFYNGQADYLVEGPGFSGLIRVMDRPVPHHESCSSLSAEDYQREVLSAEGLVCSRAGPMPADLVDAFNEFRQAQWAATVAEFDDAQRATYADLPLFKSPAPLKGGIWNESLRTWEPVH